MGKVICGCAAILAAALGPSYVKAQTPSQVLLGKVAAAFGPGAKIETARCARIIGQDKLIYLGNSAKQQKT